MALVTQDIERAMRRANLKMAWRLRFGMTPPAWDRLDAAIRAEFGCGGHEAFAEEGR